MPRSVQTDAQKGGPWGDVQSSPKMALEKSPYEAQEASVALLAAAVSKARRKGDGMSVIEHCDRFYYWLQHKGVNAGRNNVVKALGDKCEVFMPGIYDESVYAAEGAAAEE